MTNISLKVIQTKNSPNLLENPPARTRLLRISTLWFGAGLGVLTHTPLVQCRVCSPHGREGMMKERGPQASRSPSSHHGCSDTPAPFRAADTHLLGPTTLTPASCYQNTSQWLFHLGLERAGTQRFPSHLIFGKKRYNPSILQHAGWMQSPALFSLSSQPQVLPHSLTAGTSTTVGNASAFVLPRFASHAPACTHLRPAWPGAPSSSSAPHLRARSFAV